MKDTTIQKILQQTHANYEQLAAEWDKTRQHVSAGMDDFLQYIKPNSTVLDIGCGNGRVVKLFNTVNVDYTGIDNSLALIGLATKNFPQRHFVVGDMLALPFADGQFDVALCVSALHHLPGGTTRNKAVSEIRRVLKPGGTAIVSNWSWRSPKLATLLRTYTIAKIFGRSDLDFGDVYVGWGDTSIRRYVHLFSGRSIGRLLRRHGFMLLQNTLSAPTSRGFRNVVTIAKKC